MYPRSFADSDGDGVGDLRGVIDHLDYLDRLGVDVVWMSPVYRSPMDDNGYDISDYTRHRPAVRHAGRPGELIAALHARGMRLVMDLVVNHTSDEHPWFAESRSSRDNPKRDWYWWRDARPGVTPGRRAPSRPTGSRTSPARPGPGTRRTGQYYLHIFSPKQPDLNWENPEVRQAVYAMMRWWLDRGVDGFRMDVINMISKDTSLPDTQPRPGSLYGPGDQHFINGPRNHEFLAEMYREVFAGRDAHVLTVGEMPGVTIPEAVLFTDPDRHEIDMVFQFQHVQLDHGATQVRPPSRCTCRTLKPRWLRGRSVWPNEAGTRSTSATTTNLVRCPGSATTVPHTGWPRPRRWPRSCTCTAARPTCTRATSWRWPTPRSPRSPISGTSRRSGSTPRPPNATRLGLSALLLAMAKMSRDQGRTPVQWDASPGAGFTTGTPWLAINPDHTQVNAAAEVGDPSSVFEHYRRLIALRHADPVVTDGDFELLLPDHPSIWAFLRRGSDAELLVAANFSSDEVVSVGLPVDGDWSRRVRRADQPQRRCPPPAAARAEAQAVGVRRLAPRPVLMALS